MIQIFKSTYWFGEKFLIVLYFLLILSLETSGQCFERNFAFKAGEKITYDVYYNWGLIWVNAGYVEFNVKQANYLNNNVYFFDAMGRTHKGYNWFYKVEDNYRSFLDKKTLQPLWFHRKTYEGGYEVNNKYIFDYNKKKIFSFTENSDKPYKEDTLNLDNCIFDVHSLIYLARNLDFSGMKIRDTIPVISIIDNEIFSLYIRYLGKELFETRNGEKYNCIKFSALLVEGTIFKGGEDLFVWVTDDLNRVPVQVEAKILVGSVKAILSSATGLRNPSKAKVQ
ncbi:MAG: DUF3108 domain-containing protein [Bacteroidales bacterium]|nr:DUF3108 domain-containing protein [Bacteroidales bacterium]